VPCQSFPLATDDTVGHLLANHDEVATLGRQCRDRNASLLDATDEWLATAWQWYCQAIKAADLDAAACLAREAHRGSGK
jgi:hypothetical protein